MPASSRNLLLALTLGVGVSGPLLADHTPKHSFPGDPPVALFAPDIDVYPQNFAVVQDSLGVVHLGNNDGVLSFDGERWSLVQLPNRELVRSLAAAPDGRIYVGGYGAFGFLERDARGVLTFHDLTPREALEAGETFADIWETSVTPHGVFFRGLFHVFRYRPESGRVDLWRHPDRFGGLTMDGDEVVLQFRKEGLRRLVGDRWERIPNTGMFTELLERFILLPDGRLLTLYRAGQWWTYRSGRVEPFQMPAAVLPAARYTRGLCLADGTLVLARDDGWLDIVDLATGGVRSLEVAKGFLSGLVRASDGSMLLSANAGFARVEWPSTWSRLMERGMDGAPHMLRQWGARRLALTGSGVYELEHGAARFVRHDWTTHEAWDLLPLDEQRALLAQSYALLEVGPRGARPLSGNTLYPRVLRPARHAPQRILIGTELGFAILTEQGGAWRLALNLDDLGAPNVTGWVETAPREVLLASERGGIRRLVLGADGLSLQDNRVLDAAEGLDYGSARWAAIAELTGEGVVVSTESGFFRHAGGRFERVPLGGLDALRAAGQRLTLAEGPDGAQWAFDFARVFRRPPGGEWHRETIDSLRDGAIDRIAFGAGDIAYLIANGGVLRHGPVVETGTQAAPRLRLTLVEHVSPDGTRTPLPLDGAVPRYEKGAFSLALRFALPELRRPKSARYRTRVVGYRDQWSEWERSTSFSYGRLEPGEYVFEVQGQDSLGRDSEVERFTFIIEPVWYLSTGAKLVWTLLLLIAIAVGTRLVVRRRTRLLAADKSNLERMVSERTRDLEAANRMLETMAHLDGLTGIPNRRRLDDYLDQVWVQCGARERPLAILAIDVDRFKEYNDQHGHLAGDALLKKLAGLLTRSLRRTEDLAARYGGEEFLVVLPGAELDVALEVAESLRVRVASSSLGATISIGVASRVPRVGDSVADLVKAADVALYKAKETGRDRVVSDNNAG